MLKCLCAIYDLYCTRTHCTKWIFMQISMHDNRQVWGLMGATYSQGCGAGFHY